MTARRVVLNSVVVAVAFGCLPNLTHAQDGCFSNAWMNAPAFGNGGSLYGLGFVPVPPYFALHPPVYYGHRYYRSYGESPFPRSDFSSRPRRIQAEVIINPFLQLATAAAAPAAPALAPPAAVEPAPPAEVQPAEQAALQPRMIYNPYYQPEAKMAHHAQ